MKICQSDIKINMSCEVVFFDTFSMRWEGEVWQVVVFFLSGKNVIFLTKLYFFTKCESCHKIIKCRVLLISNFSQWRFQKIVFPLGSSALYTFWNRVLGVLAMIDSDETDWKVSTGKECRWGCG